MSLSERELAEHRRNGHLSVAHEAACAICHPEPTPLTALGNTTTYSFDSPRFAVLERFESPLRQCDAGFFGEIKINCPEFTSLCPKTGQPDFAVIKIVYAPDKWCVESKSLKLYLMGFRNHGAFHEACVQRIASDLVLLLDPLSLGVHGKFTPRGGIPFWPRVDYTRPLDTERFLTGGTFSNAKATP